MLKRICERLKRRYRRRRMTPMQRVTEDIRDGFGQIGLTFAETVKGIRAMQPQLSADEAIRNLRTALADLNKGPTSRTTTRQGRRNGKVTTATAFIEEADRLATGYPLTWMQAADLLAIDPVRVEEACRLVAELGQYEPVKALMQAHMPLTREMVEALARARGTIGWLETRSDMERAAAELREAMLSESGILRLFDWIERLLRRKT